VPLLAMASVCILWTSWLVFLSVTPNRAANLLMNTGEYDNGNFWLISERPASVKWTSIAGLLLVDACFLAVVVKMARFRSARARCGNDSSSGWAARMSGRFTCSSKIKQKLQRVQTFYAELTGFNAKNRKLFMS